MSSVKQLAAWNSSSSARFSPGASLSVNLTACSTWSTASLAVLRTLDEDKQWQLLAGVVWSHLLPYEGRCNLAGPACRKPSQEGRDSADKIYTIVAPRVGRLVTTTFTGPLGARSRFTSALSAAAPISSERIGRNQYVAYRRHSVSGVARDSARRVSKQMYCASFSASRSVKLRAACVNASSTVSIASLSHNSAAIDMKRRANLSCMDVKEMVSLACSHRYGRAPGCQVGRRRWLEVENYSSWLPACQQHLRFPFPWDRQVRLGLAGTMVLQEEDPPLQLPPPPQIHRQW